jgi:purine-binding chemotaxis protein CheW
MLEQHTGGERPFPPQASKRRWLVCSEGTCCVALPAGQVIETMRPLRVEPMPEMPGFVLGVAVVRGAPVPVVDMGIFLGGAGGTARRWVTVKAGDRTVALALEAVDGVRDLPENSFEAVPPLLRGAARDAVLAVGALDGQLLVVLEGARLLTAEQWLALTADGNGQ